MYLQFSQLLPPIFITNNYIFYSSFLEKNEIMQHTVSVYMYNIKFIKKNQTNPKQIQYKTTQYSISTYFIQNLWIMAFARLLFVCTDKTQSISLVIRVIKQAFSLNNCKIWIHLGFNPTALRKAKIVYNFGLSECNRVKDCIRRGK